MTQLSRPFQILLAASALFVAVWFVALRGHAPSSGGGSGSSASSASAPATTSAAAEAKAAAAPTPVYHGSAPGVEGLTRAINRAHGAVAQSQGDVGRFEHAGAEPSGSTAAGASAAGSASSARTSTTVTVQRSVSRTARHATTTVHTTTVITHAHTPAHPAPAAAKHAAGAPSMQVAVEHELQQGKTVLILFWNPHGSDDAAVHSALPAAQHSLGGNVAVHYASASQVGAFGAITHAIQITQTPTLLVVNTHGQTTVLTGLTDAFSIEQSVSESRHA